MANCGRQIPPAKRAGALSIFLALALAGAFVCLPAPESAAQERPTPSSVKAVYLYNFGKFVQWPAGTNPSEASKPFSICVLGPDPISLALDNVVKGEAINGQPLVSVRMEGVEDADNCRILFIGAMPRARLDMTLAALQSKPILTVSDIGDFCSRGGMIQFVLQGDKVRFLVNLTAAEKSGLTLSSQLLKVATTVSRTP